MGTGEVVVVKEDSDLTTAMSFKIPSIHPHWSVRFALFNFVGVGFFVLFLFRIFFWFLFFASKFCYVFITIEVSKVT